jgi:hypothetical protein
MLKYNILIMRYTGFSILFFILTIIPSSCKVSYSFSGANTGSLSTVSVQYFQDRSNLAPVNLAQTFTDELRDFIQRQTKLTMINGVAEANFDGEIRVYDGQRPVAISGDDKASLNRFTIAVNIRYTNSQDPKLNFEQTFTQYQDYDSRKSFQEVESELSGEIVKLIVEDIFNRAFVNW